MYAEGGERRSSPMTDYMPSIWTVQLSTGYCGGWRRELKRNRARSEPDTAARRPHGPRQVTDIFSPLTQRQDPSPYRTATKRGVEASVSASRTERAPSSSVSSVFVVPTPCGTFGGKSNCCIIHRISGGKLRIENSAKSLLSNVL